jgi:two-component system LytT family sensor kinase
MKSKSLDFRQIEWWFVTIAFLSILLFNLIALSNSNSWWMTHESNGLAMVLIPAILYSSFYIVHMKLMVNFLVNRNIWTLIGFSFLTLLVGFGLYAPLFYSRRANFGLENCREDTVGRVDSLWRWIGFS